MNLLSLSMGVLIGIIVAVLLVVILIIVGVTISIRNSLVALSNGCEEAWATIDVYLKKRYDLIPNLVETVKGYTKHESETLERVIAARNAAIAAPNANAKIDADNALGGTLKTLFALTESYPDLKANSQFLSLQSQLQAIENDLSQSRKFYNGKCRAYNTKIQTFPSNLVANSMQLEKRNYFELDSAEERQNVKISL